MINLKVVIFEFSAILIGSYLALGFIRVSAVGSGKGDSLTYMPLIDGPWKLIINLMT